MSFQCHGAVRPWTANAWNGFLTPVWNIAFIRTQFCLTSFSLDPSPLTRFLSPGSVAFTPTPKHP